MKKYNIEINDCKNKCWCNMEFSILIHYILYRFPDGTPMLKARGYHK